ncbi:MAG TPA: cytochrome c [Oxalicibacterium sp.]|nr:cytochrome c [Oxalicibacterium sp.]
MKRACCFACALALLALAGCEKAKQDMYDQPRYKPFAKSELFPDESSARTPPPGTMPRASGGVADASAGRLGASGMQQDVAAERAQRMPYPITQQLLQRGQQRYEIYCMPCHSPAGDGDGLVVRRGFPAPPSYHIERLRQAPDRHIYDVITNGYGIMYPYADRVAPPDRWAIVAYIRALQLSQHAPVAQLTPAMRAHLPATGAVR